MFPNTRRRQWVRGNNPQYYLEFDGVDDYGLGGASSFQLGTDNFILGMLLSIPSRDGKTGTAYILRKEGIYFRIYYWDDDRLTFRVYFSQDGTNLVYDDLEYGKTYLIVGQRYNSTDTDPNNCNWTLKSYCYDDELVLSGNIKESLARVDSDTYDLYLGANVTISSFYQGRLAHIFASKDADWDTIISDNTLRSLAGNSPKSIPDPRKIISNVTDYIPVTEGHGTNVNEIINGNDITLYNGVAWVKR